jgi:GTP pyrophosphokinase
VEDTELTVHDILNEMFNPKAAQLVEGLAKIMMVQKGLNMCQQAENFCKMILTLNDDTVLF